MKKHDQLADLIQASRTGGEAVVIKARYIGDDDFPAGNGLGAISDPIASRRSNCLFTGSLRAGQGRDQGAAAAHGPVYPARLIGHEPNACLYVLLELLPTHLGPAALTSCCPVATLGDFSIYHRQQDGPVLVERGNAEEVK